MKVTSTTQAPSLTTTTITSSTSTSSIDITNMFNNKNKNNKSDKISLSDNINASSDSNDDDEEEDNDDDDDDDDDSEVMQELNAEQVRELYKAQLANSTARYISKANASTTTESENLLQQHNIKPVPIVVHQQQQQQQHNNHVVNGENTCSSASGCLARKDLEEASAASIRKHILLKLGMEQAPNRTDYPRLSDEFKRMVCKSNNMKVEECFGKFRAPAVAASYEYQSDDPFSDDVQQYDDDDIEERERDAEIPIDEVQYLSVDSRIYAFPNGELHASREESSSLTFYFFFAAAVFWGEHYAIPTSFLSLNPRFLLISHHHVSCCCYFK